MAEADNRRIAKNTLYMYVRMGVGMLIGLYTSRIVLNALGVTDYGIYNIVGSLVVAFWFINSPLESATQRFLTFELGRNDIERLNKVFNISLQLYVVLSLLLFVVIEVVGLWFLNTHLQIPQDRMFAARCVFHISALSMTTSFLLIPFNALIISYERMSFYAYISILDALTKLLNALSLLVFTGDKLIIYAVNGFVLSFIYFIPVIIYCKKQFREVKIQKTFDKAIAREMFEFSGWSLFGATAVMSSNQGVNILLNIFFGVTVNAAMGVAKQISMAVQNFVWNFQSAFRPQIVKLYASGNISELHTLIYRTSKFSYFLLFALVCPLVFNMDYILHLWLVNPPEMASTFAVLILISALLEALSAPLYIAVQAIGDIKKYQITVSSLILMNIVGSYIFLKLGYSAYTVLIINNLISLVLLFLRIWFINRMINLSYKKYITKVVTPILLVTIITMLLTKLISYDVNTFGKLVLAVTVFAIFYIPIIYIIGLQRQDRLLLKKLVLEKFNVS